MMQSIKSNPPIKVAPLPDESPTSWLMRISLKYRISIRDLVSIYGLKELMKQPLNITADLSPLTIFLPEGMELPNTIQNKIESFEWKQGRSDWLIHPNKKGSITHNSYTRICSKCLRKKGYYQLKWQLIIFEFCIDHSIKLIDKCTKCNSPISSMTSPVQQRHLMEDTSIFSCQKCFSSFLKFKPRPFKIEKMDEQFKINQAYSESPLNMKYLEYSLSSILA